MNGNKCNWDYICGYSSIYLRSVSKTTGKCRVVISNGWSMRKFSRKHCDPTKPGASDNLVLWYKNPKYLEALFFGLTPYLCQKISAFKNLGYQHPLLGPTIPIPVPIPPILWPWSIKAWCEWKMAGISNRLNLSRIRSQMCDLIGRRCATY